MAYWPGWLACCRSAVYGVYALCLQVSPFLALAWNVLVLYLTMGFAISARSPKSPTPWPNNG